MPLEPAIERNDFDYADAFEARLTSDDGRSAEAWARAGLEGAPAWMRAIIVVAHRQVLRFRPDCGPPAEQILGWRITMSDPDVVRLETGGPLIHALLVARKTEPAAARVATFLWFQHPAADALWTAVGPLHRAFVPRLLRHAALHSTTADSRTATCPHASSGAQ